MFKRNCVVRNTKYAKFFFYLYFNSILGSDSDEIWEGTPCGTVITSSQIIRLPVESDTLLYAPNMVTFLFEISQNIHETSLLSIIFIYLFIRTASTLCNPVVNKYTQDCILLKGLISNIKIHRVLTTVLHY